MNNSIYTDIARRTEGNIYLGIVGPVRSGKSTFISRFMNTLVIPNIPDEFRRGRANDELPQSSAGKTIMTTEPKFVPEEAVSVELEEGAKMNVRLIDCVGYIVPSAIGYIENEAPRMVMTPWFDEEIPFNMAAEVGTRKVITEHSTIGIVITTDGSITDIPREEYQAAEERIIAELNEINKPFVVLLNCQNPDSAESKALAADMSGRYGATVMPVNCIDIDEAKIKEILGEVLLKFPVCEVKVKMPKWITALNKEHWLKKAVFASLKEAAADIHGITDIKSAAEKVSECEHISRAFMEELDLGTGSGVIDIVLRGELFYKILGEETGLELNDESDLMPCMIELADIKRRYERVKGALEEVEATGYGIVLPTMDELSLDEPQIIKQGGKYGVRLRASAPSIHMMSANITTEINPIVGSEKQSEELISYLLNDFEENPTKIWESNIFGKSLSDLVNEGLHNKLYRMPTDARMKLQETIQRIINDGCGGLICIIL
ncbi:MAG: stage IV sporulation protein A [Oscillospiraceae bacterium]|nr:stage IV sporulation protein A [Oscillospiraceae bacterium]